MATEKKTYKVKEGYENLTAWAAEPPYVREDKGKFVLKSCNQKDLKYLHDVAGYEGVELAE